MKNNISYYQHFSDSDQHPKFKMLRLKYGWEGDGKFWALNNRIAQAENCRIDIGKKYNVSSIACDLNFTLEGFIDFIEYLHKECNLIIKEEEFITTKTVQENLKTVLNKRLKNQKNYIQRQSVTFSDSQVAENDIQTAEIIQSKLNKSKVKESKENIIDNIVKKFQTIWNKELENYKKTYGNVDYDLQEKLMIEWINTNYLKAKNKRDFNLFICSWLSKAPLKKNNQFNYSKKDNYQRFPKEVPAIVSDLPKLTEDQIKKQEEDEVLRIMEYEEKLKQKKIEEKLERKKKKISDLEYLLESEKRNIEECKKNPKTIPSFVLEESKKEVERIEIEIKRMEMKEVG